MKLSFSLSSILLVVPSLVAASSIPLDVRALNDNAYVPRHHVRSFGRQGAFGHHNAGASSNSKSKSSTSVAATTTAAAAVGNSNKNKNKATSTSTSTSVAAAVASVSSSNKNKHKNNSSSSVAVAVTTTSSAADASASVADAGNNNDDPNTSLTLLSSLVETGLEQDGQETQEPGQVPSLTSQNNFINFCAGKTITNGKQITTGSCDPIPMGDIVPKANMPSCKFKNPKNFSTIPSNQSFTIEMTLNNLQAGNFTNAQATYYMAPQQLNDQQILIGHTHFVIQKMLSDDFADPTILDPATFTFFKGIDTAQVDGVVSVAVTAGVPPGNYRLASINTDANHTPAIVAVAQHGWLDDIIYFTAS